ncbi:MAG: GNAT family N-acetyltransferase [Gemmatimonadota bacterium]
MHRPLSRCTLRSWRQSDAERLAMIADDRAIWRMLRDRFPSPYTLADAESFIASATAERPSRNVAITVDDLVVGAIGVTPGEDIYRVTGEVGYWLDANARGRGLATEALRGFVAWLWETTDLQHLCASVFTSNRDSARVLEKSGFTLAYIARKAAVKDGTIVDEWRYQNIRAE